MGELREFLARGGVGERSGGGYTPFDSNLSVGFSVMERFARTIIGYHGCHEEFAQSLLLGEVPIDQWQPSQNEWDWLGHGVYFWEHSPQRALRWAQQAHDRPAVIGAVVQLGRCFDLLDESVTQLLTESYQNLAEMFAVNRQVLPTNQGGHGKARKLDCLVINDCLDRLAEQGVNYDTVRGAFLEGDLAYPGAGFSRETHIQLAVRNSSCILGIFKPNLSL